MTKFRIEKRKSGEHKGQSIFVKTDKNGIERMHCLLSAERKGNGIFVSAFENRRDFVSIAPRVEAASEKLATLGLDVDWKKVMEEAKEVEGREVDLHIVKVLSDKGNDNEVPFNEDGEQLLLDYDGETFSEYENSGFFSASSNINRDVENGVEYYSHREIAPTSVPSVLYTKSLVQTLTKQKTKVSEKVEANTKPLTVPETAAVMA